MIPTDGADVDDCAVTALRDRRVDEPGQQERCGDADAERGNALAGSDVCGGSRLHEGSDVNRPCCAAVLRLPARQSAGGVSVRVARLDRDVTSSAAAEIAQFKEVQ